MCKIVTLRKCKRTLEELKTEILDDIEYRKETINEDDGSSPLPCFQSHMAEVGTNANERAKSFFFASRDSHKLNAIIDALQRISENHFGHCTNNDCKNGGKIEDKRLLAMPIAHLCMTCDPALAKN